MKAKICAFLAVCLMLAGVTPASARTVATASTPLAGASNAKLNNVTLAAQALDGTTVFAGESFSFNDIVGPRTSSRGFRNAPNGRGVKVVGGGVAQTASTLYLALQALEDIRFDELKTYGNRFEESYVASGKDAVLVDYRAGTDFRFTNEGASLTIGMWVADGCVNCALYQEEEEEPAAAQGGFSEIYLDGSDAQISNITLAADSVYDTALAPGDTFSFNETVGPRTELFGYRPATNGRGVQVVGGGVAQVASALYMAVMDLPCVDILSLRTYQDRYNQHYVSDSRYAVLVDHRDDIDFSFRYTGDGTLYLYTYVEDDTLYCEVVEEF